MLFEKGELIHAHFRPRYPEDHRLRHLVGMVEAEAPGAIRVRGYLFLFNGTRSAFIRTEGMRSEIVPLDDANVTVTILPPECDVHDLRPESQPDGMRILTDGEFVLPLSVRAAGLGAT